ncbi:maleylacetoacetate isomerase [Noviherbaspirillum sedimenti]|uniref:Maleylacetoacetate isomerase n=1 Tax=Noviherbaspirillum sedimenti TaxID=2320865 RepID=A0A3A3GNW6_9BURK|nr:maleylacetoacetate isomerase [Noviherbaspirillum sedimenti]RJG04016.1 maleylacetoacetate isomerase [Noviherbaspirillum sedimenti]
MELFSFFNSSASYRVRIALGLKGVPFEYHPVNIRTGEHRQAPYVGSLNPSASVPALKDGDFSLGQSLAIIDWLDAHSPEPRLIPLDPDARARVLELSYLIACDIHPVNNLRILKYLQDELRVTPAQKDAWYQHWIAEGMAATELLLLLAEKHYGGPWCFGKEPTLADCCLIPQIANAKRFGCDLSQYSLANAIYVHAMAHPAFIQAEPKNQPDHIAP